jgi:hypothetical protein
MVDEERREMGSWSCCLPTYSQLAYQPLEERVTGSATDTIPEVPSVSGKKEIKVTHEEFKDAHEESKVVTHQEVTKETTIDARIKTETTTTTFTADEDHGESIDSVRVDTTVSYVHGTVQHDEGVAEGTVLLGDQPTITFHPVEEVSDQEDSKIVTQQQPPLAPVYSTGYAALSRFLEDHEEDAEINERLVTSSLQEESEIQQSKHEEHEETSKSEAVIKGQQDEVLESTQIDEDTHKEIKVLFPGVVIPQQDISLDLQRERIQDQDDDAACCGPTSKWFWGRRKYTSEEAQLRQPLLRKEETTALRRDSEEGSQDSAAHVTIQQTHEVTETRTGERVIATDDAWCEGRCFPWFRRETTETVGTTVTVSTDDTVIQVEGTDATSTLEAATQAAEDAGMLMEEPAQEGGYLKSIVYGGLDVSLTSLGVVAAAAGGDAKTRNILALGLSNLIFGFLTFFYKIQDMRKENPARFHETVGPRFWINGPLAMLSFLVFGALPVLVFAFSFRELNDHDYKMAATVLASTIAVIFLGCGKVAAKMTTLSYWRTLSTLIVTGIVAAVAGFYTGEYINKMLQKYGILDE